MTTPTQGPKAPTAAAPRLETRRFDAETIEVRAGGDEASRSIGGVAIRFNSPTPIGGYFKEKFAPGAFDEYLADDKTNTRALMHHDNRLHLASRAAGSLTLTATDQELRFEAEVVKTTVGDDALELVRSNEVRGVSVGFYAVEETWEKLDDGTELRTITKAKLPEFTLTPTPAYTDTNVEAREAEAILERRADGDGEDDAGEDGDESATPTLTEQRRRLNELVAGNN